MLKDQSAIEANLIYLEAESASIPGGALSNKSWIIYGSPVCSFSACMTDRMGSIRGHFSIHQNSEPWGFHTHETRQMVSPPPAVSCLSSNENDGNRYLGPDTTGC